MPTTNTACGAPAHEPLLGLAGAVLYVKDLPRLCDFYARITGLPVHPGEADHAVLQGAGLPFTLVQMPPHIADSVVVRQPPERREDTPIKLVFNVASLDVARADVTALGGEMNPPSRQWPWQGRIVCDGHDPEGNVFQLSMPGG